MENETKAAERRPPRKKQAAGQEAAAGGGAPPQQVVVRPMQFGPLRPAAAESEPVAKLELLLDVGVRVSVELGRAHMSIRKVLGLSRGSVIELDKVAGEPVDVYVNDTLIARGEVVVVGEKFGVRVTELVSAGRVAEPIVS